MIWNILYLSIFAFSVLFSVALILWEKIWRKNRKAQFIQIMDGVFSLILILLVPVNAVFSILATIYSFPDTTPVFAVSLLFTYVPLSGCLMTPLDRAYAVSRKKYGFGNRFSAPTLYEATLDGYASVFLSFLYYVLTLSLSPSVTSWNPFWFGIVLLAFGLILIVLGLFALKKKPEEKKSGKQIFFGLLGFISLLVVTWVFPLFLILLLYSKNETIGIVLFCLSFFFLLVYLLFFNCFAGKRKQEKEFVLTWTSIFQDLRLFSLGAGFLFLVFALIAFISSFF